MLIPLVRFPYRGRVRQAEIRKVILSGEVTVQVHYTVLPPSGEQYQWMDGPYTVPWKRGLGYRGLRGSGFRKDGRFRARITAFGFGDRGWTDRPVPTEPDPNTTYYFGHVVEVVNIRLLHVHTRK
jgi:hypothetical protein